MRGTRRVLHCFIPPNVRQEEEPLEPNEEFLFEEWWQQDIEQICEIIEAKLDIKCSKRIILAMMIQMC